MIIPNTIEDLLIDFDEMWFEPTAICPNPEEYARAWKKSLIKAIEDERKKTAKEILSNFLNVIHEGHAGNDFVVVYVSDIKNLAKCYGVEVTNENDNL